MACGKAPSSEEKDNICVYKENGRPSRLKNPLKLELATRLSIITCPVFVKYGNNIKDRSLKVITHAEKRWILVIIFFFFFYRISQISDEEHCQSQTLSGLYMFNCCDFKIFLRFLNERSTFIKFLTLYIPGISSI